MPDIDTPAPRTAIRFAAYAGDRRRELIADPVMGPNMLGELMTVVSATYDPETSTTRAGFAFATTHDVPATPPLGLRLVDSQRVMALFGNTGPALIGAES